MKRIIVLLSLCVISGCGMTASQRVAILEEMLKNAESASDQVGKRLTQIEATIEETQIALADPNLPGEYRDELDTILADSLAKVRLVSTEHEKWAARITTLREQVEETKADDMSVGDELILYGKSLTTIGKSVPAPVGPFITLGGVIVGAIGGIVAKRRKGQLTAVVGSVEDLLDSGAVPHPADAKDVLKKSQARHAGVRAAVDKIRKGTA